MSDIQLRRREHRPGDQVAPQAEHRAAQKARRDHDDGLRRPEKALDQMGHRDAHKGDRPREGRDAGGEDAGQQDQLELARGQIMTLIGPNGAGKSTILKSVIRQLEPVGGAVYLDGRDMAGLSERETAQRMSVLMTSHVRPELMTCEDVVATGRYGRRPHSR